MKKFLLLLCLPFCVNTFAQQSAPLFDSAKAKISRAATPADKVTAMHEAAWMLMNTNLEQSDDYGRQMIEVAELSGDRKLMVQALRKNGERYEQIGFKNDFVSKANGYYERALSMARSYNFDREVGSCLNSLARMQLKVPNADKALAYANQAFVLATQLKNDSLLVATHMVFAEAYGAKNERLLSLRHYLNALQIAEEKNLFSYQRNCYNELSDFYVSLEQYDKAIDYLRKAIAVLPKLDAERAAYGRAALLNAIGRIYTYKKDKDMALFYYNQSIKLADSLKYPPLKIPGYYGLLTEYANGDEPKKALEFLNKNVELRPFFSNFRMLHSWDAAYGGIYSRLGRFDSAEYYFKRAEPGFATSTPEYRINFYSTLNQHYKLSGNKQAQLRNLLRADTLARQAANLEWMKWTAKEMDTVYAKLGKIDLAYQQGRRYHQFNDSLTKLNAEKDLLQAEIKDEEVRQQRITAEAEATKARRHQVQYLAITIFIAGLFVLLAISGFVRVSDKAVRIVGYFSFLMFFEFIFLISKKSVGVYTGGEPWKDLTFMILLAAVLLPLHHWMEEKVMHYLAAQRRKRLQAAVDKSGTLVSHSH